ncbi:MAG: hypothetical protein ABI254_04930, partial [Chthoniobacterales bacterium]
MTQFSLHFLKRSVLVLSVLLALPSLHASTVSNWQDGTSNAGTFTWETSGNWDNGIPTSSTFQSVITHATGNLTITTAAAYTITSPNFIVNSGSLTFKLGGDFTGATTPVITNATNDSSKLVFDLNGNTLGLKGYGGGAGYFTIASTAGGGGGTAQFNQILNTTHGSVQNNTTLQLTGAGSQSFTGFTFSAGSTLWVSQVGNTFISGFPTLGIGNLTIGSSTNSTLSYFTNSNSTTYRVTGNVTLNKGTTANQDSYITFGAADTKIYVGGNFTDVGGSGASTVTDYATTGGGSGLLAFNGGAGSQKSVSIGRTGLTNNFQVGESATIFGNIGLAKSLTTTGTFKMFRGSRLNVAALTLTAGSLNLADDAGGNHLTIADTFGTTNGLITTSGNLSLNTFNLELNFDGTSWTNGSNLLLFHYGGTFTGTLA